MNNDNNQTGVLITGATGFIGSHLAKHLVAKGRDVHVLVRPNSKLFMIEPIIDQITVHYHDATTEGLSLILKKAKPGVIFHLASLFLAQHHPKDIEPILQSNVIFGAQLVESMVSNGIFHLINTGTSWQHYENQDYNPVSLYAASKEAFETILKFYTETTPLRAITLKLFDTYGPYDPRPKLFTLLSKIATKKESFAMSPGEQLLDIVFIDDVIEAFLVASELLLTNPNIKQEDYSVSSNQRITLKNLVSIYESISGKKLNIEWGGRPYRQREVMIPWENGLLLPGWCPQIKIEDGIKKIVEYYNIN